jgi:predicted DNA-binding protein with PD1-like motif
MKKLPSVMFAAALLAIICHAAFAQARNAQPASQNKQQESKREEAASDRVKTYVLRLKPGQDLRSELELLTKAKNIQAGFIVTCVGSLRKASLRLADKSDSTNFDGKFEIVSLVGTLTPDGPHLHLSISDGEGKTIGGHLVAGCEIYTTAEIVIGDAVGLKMTRELDEQSGYKELKVRNAPSRKP